MDCRCRLEKTALFLIVLGALTSGCVEKEVEIPPPEEPAAGLSSVGGQVIDARDRWDIQTVEIYAAPFYADENSNEGFFLLEPNLHPHASLDQQGIFSLRDIPPGQYVLVAGPTVDEARQIVGEDGEAVIFTFLPDEIYPLGELRLAP